MTTVLLADDHSIIREGFKIYIKNILPHSIIEEAFDGDSAFEKIKHNNYNLIILDVNMPDTDTFSLVGNIMAVKPESRILIFSMNPEEMYAKKLLDLGVLGYLNKAAFTGEIKQAIENVINNKRYFSPSLLKALDESTSGKEPDNENPFDLLSRRELEITRRLLNGHSVSQIGSSLYLDSATVSADKEKIFEKLQCKNMPEVNELAKLHHFIQSN